MTIHVNGHVLTIRGGQGVKVKESTVFSRKYCTELTNLSTLSVFEVDVWCYRGGNTVPKWILRETGMGILPSRASTWHLTNLPIRGIFHALRRPSGLVPSEWQCETEKRKRREDLLDSSIFRRGPIRFDRVQSSHKVDRRCEFNSPLSDI
jgi:hypothetical protein